MSHKNKSALTLSELIVGAAMIGFMMVGIASMDFGLRQSHRGSSRNAILAMRTSAIMLHISKNIQLATGDHNNIGIAPATSSSNLWIRKENPTNPTPNPNDYTDDIWISYWLDSTTHNLYFCTVPNSTTACTNGAEAIGTLVSFSETLTIDNTPGSEKFYVNLNLTNRFDPASTVSTFDNPEYTLTTRVYPKSSSF